MFTRLTKLLLLALAIAATAAGCGGDDEGDGGGEPLSTSSLSKTEYIAQVDEICARDRRKTPKELQTYISEQDPGLPQRGDESFTTAVRAVFVPALETKIDEISALGAPSGDEEQVEEFLDAMQQTVDELNEKPVGSLTEFGEELEPAADIAREYGFSTCS